jgi:hypothetical protein
MDDEGDASDSCFSSSDDEELPVIKTENIDGKQSGEYTNTSDKLAAMTSVSQRVTRIDSLSTVDGKFTSLMERGPVLAFTSHLIQEHSKETVGIISSSIDEHTSSIDLHPKLFYLPPGVPFFVRPISYMTSSFSDMIPVNQLSKFSTLLESLISSKYGVRDLIVNKLLVLMYQVEPCPQDVLFWLFELSCCSTDYFIRKSAFESFMDLLPSITEVQSCYTRLCVLLEKLGIQRNNHVNSCSQDVHNERDAAEILQSAVNYIAQFLIFIFSKYSEALMGQVNDYAAILLNIVLDPCICRSPVASNIWRCFDVLLSSVQDHRVIELFLVEFLSKSNMNPLNVVFVIQSLPQQLQRQLAKQFLIMSSKSDNLYIEESELAVQVVNYYLQMDNNEINYTELYSVVMILGIFIRQPYMKWERECKARVVTDLNTLAVRKLQENVMKATEIGPVKDLIIRMRLNLKEEARNNCKNEQTTLFNYYSTSS